MSNSSSKRAKESNSSSESSVASSQESKIPEGFLFRGNYHQLELGFEDNLEAAIGKLPNNSIKTAIQAGVT